MVLAVRSVARQRPGRAGHGAQKQRSALRTDFAVVLTHVARCATPSAHCVRCGRTKRCEFVGRSALTRAATCAALLAAAHSRRVLPAQPFAGPAVVSSCPECKHGLPRARRPAGAGDFWGAEARSVRGGVRSTLRQHACRILFECSEQGERNELCGTPGTGGTGRESVRSADRHSMSQNRLAAWRGRTERRTSNAKPENLDSRLRGNDERGLWE